MGGEEEEERGGEEGAEEGEHARDDTGVARCARLGRDRVFPMSKPHENCPVAKDPSV